jgi:tRNA A37 threonylcarbamoyltransferase TsaD
MGLHEIKNLLYNNKKKWSPELRGCTQNRKNLDSFISGLITRIYRELKNLTLQKTKDTVKKWTNELNRAFSKEEVQMV